MEQADLGSTVGVPDLDKAPAAALAAGKVAADTVVAGNPAAVDIRAVADSLVAVDSQAGDILAVDNTAVGDRDSADKPAVEPASDEAATVVANLANAIPERVAEARQAVPAASLDIPAEPESVPQGAAERVADNLVALADNPADPAVHQEIGPATGC